GRGSLLEERGADPYERDGSARRTDRRSTSSPANIARLAEAVAVAQNSDLAAPRPYADLAGNDNVEAVVELALANDVLSGLIVAPLAGPQNFPDLRMREVVKEAQLAQQVKLRLLVDAVVLVTQRLK